MNVGQNPTKARAGDRKRGRRYTQKRKPAENDEFLWLVSLSDLMILLFIFFVVLFAFTRDKLKESDLMRIVAAIRSEKDPMEEVHKNLEKWVEDQKLKDQIDVAQTADGIEIRIKDKLLFSSGESKPLAQGVATLELLAKTLEKIPKANEIGIEGHTDDVPIHTKDVQDNWDLSAKRAWAVLNAMNLPNEMKKRMVIMGYGDSRPIAPNRDAHGNSIPENQSKNRRVTIRIF